MADIVGVTYYLTILALIAKAVWILSPWRIRREGRFGPLRIVRGSPFALTEGSVHVRSFGGKIRYEINKTDVEAASIRIYKWQKLNAENAYNAYGGGELIPIHPITVEVTIVKRAREEGGATTETRTLQPDQWRRLYRRRSATRPTRKRRRLLEVMQKYLTLREGQSWGETTIMWGGHESAERQKRHIILRKEGDTTTCIHDAQTGELLGEVTEAQVEAASLELKYKGNGKGNGWKRTVKRYKYANRPLTIYTPDGSITLKPSEWEMIGPYVGHLHRGQILLSTPWRPQSSLPEWIQKRELIGGGGVGWWQMKGNIVICPADDDTIGVYDWETGEEYATEQGSVRYRVDVTRPVAVKLRDEAVAIAGHFRTPDGRRLEPGEWAPLVEIGGGVIARRVVDGPTPRLARSGEIEEAEKLVELVSWKKADLKGQNPAPSVLEKFGLTPDYAHLLYRLTKDHDALWGHYTNRCWDLTPLVEAYETAESVLS